MGLRPKADALITTPQWVLGVMSGTSLDGVDVACSKLSWCFETHSLVCTDVAVFSVPMPVQIREQLLALQVDGAGNRGTLKQSALLHQSLGVLFAEAVAKALASWGIAPADVLCVGSHGQTVYHQPPTVENPLGVTVQLGDLAVMAARLNLPVIGDFRLRDMAVGGQGAPLVPFLDALFFAESGKVKCLQNMGGIGNVTVLNGVDADPIAFDTGPGNMLIDGAMQALFGLPFDENGETAERGTLIPALLARLKQHPFLGQHPPKSTGRQAWGASYFQPLLAEFLPHHPPENLITTLTAFTAWSLVDAYERYVLPNLLAIRPFTPDIESGKRCIDEVLITGGGAYNPALLRWIQHWMANSASFSAQGGVPVFSTAEVYGMPNMAKEAVAFALLAWARWFGLPNNLPACTGASAFVSMGHCVI